MLDHHHGSALFNESLKYAEERFHIARVQADSGLVEHEHGIGLPAAHLACEFQTLRLAARKRGRGFAEREIPQAQVMQGLQLFVRLLDVGHMRKGFVDGKREQVRQTERLVIGRAFFRSTNFLGSGVVARSAAVGAGNVDVG